MTDYRCDACGSPLRADEATAYCDPCERVGNAAEDVRMNADLSVIARRNGNEARHIAAIAGTTEYVHSRPDPNDGRLPESAFGWPIYRAAIVADVYGALWGQASESEEKVLDVLARCAGLVP